MDNDDFEFKLTFLHKHITEQGVKFMGMFWQDTEQGTLSTMVGNEPKARNVLHIFFDLMEQDEQVRNNVKNLHSLYEEWVEFKDKHSK